MPQLAIFISFSNVIYARFVYTIQYLALRFEPTTIRRPWFDKVYKKINISNFHQGKIGVFFWLKITIFGLAVQANQVLGPVQLSRVVDDQRFKQFATLKKVSIIKYLNGTRIT
jgi:hypothetical protein